MKTAGKIGKTLKRIWLSPYHFLDGFYLPRDRAHIRRTRNIRLIPKEKDRRGGKYSYAEWAHVIGIFQTLMFLNLQRKEDNTILDVGCGTGLLGIASEPFLGDNGKYIGIDVSKRDIDFCRRQYPDGCFEFIHFDVANPAYAPGQKEGQAPWPVEGGTADLVTALSVWTHLNEQDAMFYFTEVNRVLEPGGKAIITCFLLDDSYRSNVGMRSARQGRYHMTSQDDWIFDRPSYGSDAWFHPASAEVPESAIGITDAGLKRLMSAGGMELVEHHPGNWKEVPGVFFQDVLIFRKPGEQPA